MKNSTVREIRTALATASGVELLDRLPFLAAPLRRLERHPVWHGVVLSAFGLRQPLFVDHLTDPRPRFGHGRPDHPAVREVIARGADRYARQLDEVVARREVLGRIPVRADLSGTEPYWANGWLPPLDAAALCTFLAAGNPRRYVEIGSGNSTKFARRTIHDCGLRTRIISIDPAPRATVDRLCDQVVRQPLEDTDLALFSDLDAGDVVFFDGSHRVLMGSDVTVFFFEVLPRLRPGVLVHVHDIWLPSDYPPEWRWRHYSEQYLLAAFLLGSPDFDIELPNAYVAAQPDLAGRLAPLWRQLALAQMLPPTSFWLRRAVPAEPTSAPGQGRDRR